ncbi:MAG TPA: RNA 3'-terminal phosphate cyclase [Anaerolineae bacterium]|nr:RNA 3'-terminal phosphate cyclase [Anaerolineae bacterium]
MLTIDGSTGEGGGQIVRSALSLAAILGQPVEITNIRAGRKQPGLRPQHVQAVRAAAAICNARLEGVQEHSRALRFEPQTPPQAGAYGFEIGTAGATTLVLQTILPPLALAGGPSSVVVRGGTHVAWSPPFDYVEQVYLPALAALGIDCRVELVKWGFYPKGGGEIRATIQPSPEAPALAGLRPSQPTPPPVPPALAGLRPSQPEHPPVPPALAGLRPSQPTLPAALAGLRPSQPEHPPVPPALAGLRPSQPEPWWTEPRGPLSALSVLSASANVGNQVTARLASRAYNRLAATRLGVTPQTRLVNPPSSGPGACLFVLAEYEGGVRAGFTGYGRQGYPAERVADDAVDAFLAFQASDAPVDPHLADQLILPLALADQPLTFRTSQISQHLLTNIWVVEQFLGPRFAVSGQVDEPGEVTVR